MNCVACNQISKILFNKDGYDYYQCGYCQTVFVPEGISQIGMVGGEHEVGRNEKENGVRIERIKELVGKYGRVLDFGCGHGYLINDCKAAAINAVGYDKFNSEFDKIPEGQFNICTVIECLEHWSGSMEELDIIHGKLLPGAVVMLESSFVDVAIEENIPLESFFYIAPQNGHSTIFSHYGLDVLMQRKNYKVIPAYNRNVRLYQKKT